MSYAGSVLAMITSLKNNKREIQTPFKNKDNRGISNYHKKLKETKATPVYLEMLKTKTRREARILLIKKMVTIAIISGILIYIWYSL